MLNLEYLQQSLIIAIALSTIKCAFIQKTKCCFNSSKYLALYSILVNIFVGIVFCMTFTSIDFPNSLWIGMFSFLGADTIYKTLEVIYQIGESLGNYIRRKTENKMCNI